MVDVFNPRVHASGSARELITATIGADPYQGIEAMRKAGERKARAEGVAYELEHLTKTVLARIAGELAEVHAKEKLAEAKLERMARTDVRYEAHVRKVAAAVEEKELASNEYWAIRSELEWDGHSVFHANALAKLER